MSEQPPHFDGRRSAAGDDRPDEADAWGVWRAAARRPAIHRAIGELYRRLDADIARHSPTCWTSGRCCNFDAFGHRLYVTGLEIAWFLQQAGPPTPPPGEPSPGRQQSPHLPLPQFAPSPAAEAALPAACAYQVNRKCSVHGVRPLGCRVFFCQAGTEGWQAELYERYLTELRRLHEREEIPYQYMEWRAGLAEAVGAMTSGQ